MKLSEAIKNAEEVSDRITTQKNEHKESDPMADLVEIAKAQAELRKALMEALYGI